MQVIECVSLLGLWHRLIPYSSTEWVNIDFAPDLRCLATVTKRLTMTIENSQSPLRKTWTAERSRAQAPAKGQKWVLSILKQELCTVH